MGPILYYSTITGSFFIHQEEEDSQMIPNDDSKLLILNEDACDVKDLMIPSEIQWTRVMAKKWLENMQAIDDETLNNTPKRFIYGVTSFEKVATSDEKSPTVWLTIKTKCGMPLKHMLKNKIEQIQFEIKKISKTKEEKVVRKSMRNLLPLDDFRELIQKCKCHTTLMINAAKKLFQYQVGVHKDAKAIKHMFKDKMLRFSQGYEEIQKFDPNTCGYEKLNVPATNYTMKDVLSFIEQKHGKVETNIKTISTKMHELSHFDQELMDVLKEHQQVEVWLSNMDKFYYQTHLPDEEIFSKANQLMYEADDSNWNHDKALGSYCRLLDRLNRDATKFMEKLNKFEAEATHIIGFFQYEIGIVNKVKQLVKDETLEKLTNSVKMAMNLNTFYNYCMNECELRLQYIKDISFKLKHAWEPTQRAINLENRRRDDFFQGVKELIQDDVVLHSFPGIMDESNCAEFQYYADQRLPKLEQVEEVKRLNELEPNPPIASTDEIQIEIKQQMNMFQVADPYRVTNATMVNKYIMEQVACVRKEICSNHVKVKNIECGDRVMLISTPKHTQRWLIVKYDNCDYFLCRSSRDRLLEKHKDDPTLIAIVTDIQIIVKDNGHQQFWLSVVPSPTL